MDTAQIVGLVMGALGGALAGWGVASAWPRARFGRFGAPALGALSAGPAILFLQTLGAGGLGVNPGTGIIEWNPVIATLMAGAGCGAVASVAAAIAFRQAWGRRRRRRPPESLRAWAPPPRPERSRAAAPGGPPRPARSGPPALPARSLAARSGAPSAAFDRLTGAAQGARRRGAQTGRALSDAAGRAGTALSAGAREAGHRTARGGAAVALWLWAAGLTAAEAASAGWRLLRRGQAGAGAAARRAWASIMSAKRSNK